MTYQGLRQALRAKKDDGRAELSKRYFKTGKGEYGEGDVFLGLTVPLQRRIARDYTHLSVPDVIKLLQSRIHEERFTALVLMVDRYQKGDNRAKKQVFDQYLKNAKWVNNWDLVDTSAPQIVGDYCLTHGLDDRLRRLSRSPDIWKRRIAVLSTFMYIRKGKVDLSLEISETLLRDGHDLIHKAVGWMLREARKRQARPVHSFLEKHAATMPRTMLRYAIEKFPDRERKRLMAKRSAG